MTATQTTATGENTRSMSAQAVAPNRRRATTSTTRPPTHMPIAPRWPTRSTTPVLNEPPIAACDANAARMISPLVRMELPNSARPMREPGVRRTIGRTMVRNRTRPSTSTAEITKRWPYALRTRSCHVVTTGEPPMSSTCDNSIPSSPNSTAMAPHRATVIEVATRGLRLVTSRDRRRRSTIMATPPMTSASPPRANHPKAESPSRAPRLSMPPSMEGVVPTPNTSDPDVSCRSMGSRTS